MVPRYGERMLLRSILRVLGICGTLVFAVACGSGAAPDSPGPVPHSLAVPTSTPQLAHSLINPIWQVSPSIEEQILTSSVIVRASLRSATAQVETVSGGEGVAATYRPVQELRFTAHEYLKGSGPNEAVVVVRGDHTYLTEVEARAAAEGAVTGRNTAWDGRQGVLFLRQSYPAYSPSGGVSGQTPAKTFGFTLSNHEVQSEWEYSIDTLSRAWLPAEDTGGASGQAGGSVFITDGSESPSPTISLAGLRSKVGEIEALRAAGDNTAEYQRCINSKIMRERHFRERPYIPLEYSKSISSGLAAGTLIYTYSDSEGTRKYFSFWTGGPNSDLFRTAIVDDDSVSTNGYDYTLETARPLLTGQYRVFYHGQHYDYLPCDFKPDNTPDNWTVTVTAPDGTLHEAIFDPVAIGTAVGADASNGVLNPAGFTVGGTAAAIKGLRWQGGSVALTLEPYAPMTGHVLDVIALDGSVSLSLGLATGGDQTASSRKVLTWVVAQQPWQDGDKLMLRIRQPDSTPPAATPAPPKAPVPSGLTATASGSGSIVLSWTPLAGASRYGVYRQFQATSDFPSHWGKVSENVTSATYTVSGLVCGTTYHYGIAAYGDGVTYAASWSASFSAPVSATTGACDGPGS